MAWTVNAIKAAVRAKGSHWFDPDTMRFFGTRVHHTVYEGPGGVYFITGDKAGPREESGRGYTVRRFFPETLAIDTVGELAGSRNLKAARLKARNLARSAGELAEVIQNKEEFQEVTTLQQFVDDLRTHGNPPKPIDMTRVGCLVQLAAQHHRLMEQLCSDEAFCRLCDADGNHPSVTECRDSIREVARRVGAGVVFSGDPRGCTVKLTFADGFTNDFAHEGYCVPTGDE